MYRLILEMENKVSNTISVKKKQTITENQTNKNDTKNFKNIKKQIAEVNVKITEKF